MIAVLVQEACAQLERRGEGARRLDLRYERVDATVQVVSAGTPRPVRDARHLARMLEERIEQVDRLSNRLGADRVYRLMPLESDALERSQSRVPVFGRAAATPWISPWPRPVRLLCRPEPVEALAMVPDHPPRAFTRRRVRHHVTRADGPERVTGEWWRRSDEFAAVRDYWTVQNTEGRRFRLYRQVDGLDPANGRLAWFLHGFFWTAMPV